MSISSTDSIVTTTCEWPLHRISRRLIAFGKTDSMSQSQSTVYCIPQCKKHLTWPSMYF